MISVLRAIETLMSVKYRELYRARRASPPGRLENSIKDSPPLLPKEPEKTPATKMLYRLSRSTNEHEERDSSSGKTMQRIYYQDAYSSQVHLDYINPSSYISLSPSEDEEVKSSSPVVAIRPQPRPSSRGELQGAANSSSNQDANSISSSGGRDEETVNDVLEIIHAIRTQPFSECEAQWLKALRDAEQTSTDEAPNEPQIPPMCTSNVPSALQSITHQDSFKSAPPEGDNSNPIAANEAGSTSPPSHRDETRLQHAASHEDSSTSENDGFPSQPQQLQESVQGVIQRTDATVAQTLEISEANSSVLPSPQAQGRSSQPGQPLPPIQRQSHGANQPGTPATAAPQPIAMGILAATHSMTLPTPIQPPTSSLGIGVPASNTPPVPPPVQITKNKRRLGNGVETPPEVNAKTQRKGPSPPKAAPTPTPNSVFPAPLPAESSFIPILHEGELEDVVKEGTPVRLGKGVFGEVLLKKRISDGSLVAVKQLLDVKDSMEAYKEMVKEIRTMMAVQHLNEFPKVLGIIDQEHFAIEFVGDPVTKTSSNLNSILANPPVNLETLDWIQICLDIARGVLALHTAGWSHNDLHNGNVMVWSDVSRPNKWGAKIIDLGLATRLDLPLPPFMFDSAKKSWCYKKCPHLAPDVIEGVCQQGEKSDVYSLGHFFRTISDTNAELTSIRDLSEMCCKRMPHDRPHMDSVVKDIEKFQREVMNKKRGTRGRVTGFR